MSSSKYAAPLYLRRCPSRPLTLFLVATHGVGLLLLPWVALPWELAGCLGLGISVSLYRSLRDQALLSSSRAIIEVSWDGEGVWRLRQRNGIEWRGKLLPSYYAGPRLILLSFVLGPVWRRASIVLLPGSIELQALRRLRVRLRITRLDQPELRS